MNDHGNYIRIIGAKAHNLKNISVDIPKNKLIVITGISGSGKSSLAFDTIFAEGQRRYVESMSNFARQFMGVLEKPNVDEIKNLSPALSIDQKSSGDSPRSTVGTMSDIYDYLRLLFATIGVPHCLQCSLPMKKKSNHHLTKKEKEQIEDWRCPNCENTFPKVNISLFSFNSPVGACLLCHGLGQRLEIDPSSLMPNPRLTIEEGAIRPLQRLNPATGWMKSSLQNLAAKHNFKLDVPVGRYTSDVVKLILYGDEENEGLIKYLTRRHDETDSDYMRREIERYMVKKLCPACKGKRLKKEALNVKIGGRDIVELADYPVSDLKNIIDRYLSEKSPINKKDKKIVQQLLKEIRQRIQFLIDVGLPYLTLNRSSQSLAGGESQRIRLASQLGSGLVGVVYILDEPSIGLHARDHAKLLRSIRKLQKLGNTVIVVEHDRATMEEADWIIDIGPGAGESGGRVVGVGSVEDIKKAPESITGKFLSGKESIPANKKKRVKKHGSLVIKNAAHFNLKNISVEIPLQRLVVITGVSGSGKSTLVSDILASYLLKHFYRAKTNPGRFEKIEGVENLDKVIVVDQSPIGRNVRSNPATYTGVFTLFRKLFAGLPEAEKKNIRAEDFSFNLVGGRCETCRGDGMLKFEMHFMPNVFITCERCQGKRYKDKVLSVKYRDKSIADLLDMTVDEALKLFRDHQDIVKKLKVLQRVGLGYLKLGQPATMLSGGEAQRVKLANELARPATGKTLYILDEPTSGLHFADTKKLLDVLSKLVDRGNTVLIVEHNLDVIKNADWIIDLGPEGGEKGGEVVAQGAPVDIAKDPKSYTGRYLKKVLV